MKAAAEITDRRVAQKMLERVGYPSDATERWPARGPADAASGLLDRFADEALADHRAGHSWPI